MVTTTIPRHQKNTDERERKRKTTIQAIAKPIARSNFFNFNKAKTDEVEYSAKQNQTSVI